MSDSTPHTQLIRILAKIDGLLAEVEDAIENPEGDDVDGAHDLAIEFQDAKQRVESMLRSE